MSHATLARLIAAAALVVTATFSGPSHAVAEDFTFDVPAGGACPGFALRVAGTGAKLHNLTFEDADGNIVRTLTAGTGFDLTFTNLTTGSTVSLRGNGSVTRTVPHGDGTVTKTSTGHTVLLLFPTDHPAGPSTTLFVGRVVYDVDADSVFTIRKVSGRTSDICARLAA
jgi:hypothetical protein